jgi:cyclopropane-fatty-acyl-phospholipid synthase
MAEALQKPVRESATNAVEFVQFLLRDFHLRNFSVEFSDGSCWPAEKSQFHRFTWKIYNPAALRQALFASNREIALANAYINGDFEILGDFEAIFPLVDYLIHKKWSATEKLHVLKLAFALPKPERMKPVTGVSLSGVQHSPNRDQQAICYHYDVSNEFYSLWLDRNMVYSAGLFESQDDDDINTAQVRKFDYICQKLRLKPGERLLDIGCGWGGLILHAVRNYGARALGITLSHQQFEWSSARIRDLGFSHVCQVEIRDYREVEGTFDKLVSIGMVEHVGKSHLAEYFQHAYRLLRPRGVFLNSGIGRSGARANGDESKFTDEYIFPDAQLVTIADMLSPAEGAGFEVRAVENLREHYMLTVRRWLQRLEAHASQAEKLVGTQKYRMWHLYLAGSAFYFQKGWLDLYHTLLAKPEDGDNGIPLIP